MLQIILSSIAVTCTCACIVALFLKRDERLPCIALIAALTASAALELFDLFAILKPEDLLFWKNFSLGAEGILIFFWLLFSSIYARRGAPKSPVTAEDLPCHRCTSAGCSHFHSDLTVLLFSGL